MTMEIVNQGYVSYLSDQSEKALSKLLERLFPDPVWYFDGQVKTCTFTPKQKPVLDPATLSGRAFDSQTEVRWRQLQPGKFDVTILSEDKSRLPTAAKLIHTFTVDKGRTKSETGLVRSPDPDDRRWPNAPRGTKDQISYVYYRDSLTGQIRFMRMRPASKSVVSGKAQQEVSQ